MVLNQKLSAMYLMFTSISLLCGVSVELHADSLGKEVASQEEGAGLLSTKVECLRKTELTAIVS